MQKPCDRVPRILYGCFCLLTAAAENARRAGLYGLPMKTAPGLSTAEKMIDHVLRVMISNFVHCEKLPGEAGKDLSLHSFCRDEKVNIVTGEKKASYLCPFDSAEWVQLQPFTEWTFWGWTFTDPLKGFCG